MQKKSYLIALVLVLGTISHTFAWERIYGEGAALCVQETSDGGYIATGSNAGNVTGNDALWLLKLDAEGDTVWTRMFFGEAKAVGRCVRQAKDGGYIVAGSTHELPGPGEQWDDDLFLVKTDSLGDTIWTRIYGEKTPEDTVGFWHDDGYWIEETPDGGYIVTGVTRSFSWFPGLVDALWLLKLDENGDTLWTRTHEVQSSNGYCLCLTRDGGYAVVGEVWDTTGFLLWLVKTNDQGDTLWTRQYGVGEGDGGWSVCETPDGGYVIAGIYMYASDYDSTDVWLLRTDSEGDTLWTRRWSGEEKGGGYSVDLTSDGGYIVTGEDWGSLCLIKVDSSGDTQWERNYWGGSSGNRGYHVEETSDKGYVIAGCQFFAMSGRFWLIKTDSAGNLGISSPVTPVTHPVTPVTHLEIVNPIGREIVLRVLRYSDSPQGFHASVFDASGRRVDELKAPNQSGVLIWGPHQSPGVYFIVPETGETQVLRVVLVK